MSRHDTIDAHTTLTLATHPAASDHEHDTEYLLRFWLPILGPTPLAIRERALLHLDTHGQPAAGGLQVARWNANDLALAAGIGNVTLSDNLWRAARHGFWHHEDLHEANRRDAAHGRYETACCWTIPRPAPLLPARIVARRDAGFQAAHTAFLLTVAGAGTADRAGQL